MDVLSHLSYLIVADGEDRKPVGAGPLFLVDERLHGVETVEMEVGAEEAVHHEQLSETVAEKEQFTDEVEYDEKVSVFLPTEYVTATSQFLEPMTTTLSVVSVMAQISVYQSNHVAEVLLLALDVV